MARAAPRAADPNPHTLKAKGRLASVAVPFFLFAFFFLSLLPSSWLLCLKMLAVWDAGYVEVLQISVRF